MTNYHVLNDDTSNGFDSLIGLATNEAGAIALLDVDGWNATSAYYDTVQMPLKRKTRAEIEALYADELQAGTGHAHEVWGGWVVTMDVICVESEEIE